jgi:opacity protein-like surface antigen
MSKFVLTFIATVLCSFQVSAANLSYDLGATVGSQNNNSYSEIQLGLNWFVQDWLNWRNAVFTRFGTNVDSVSGLDSTLRATYTTESSGGGFGFQAFAGPGVRLASENNTGALAEAGLMLKLGGLVIGGGGQYISYFNTRQDSRGYILPKEETQYFLILGGGGSF